MSSLTCISGIISVSQAYGLGETWLWAMSVCWWITVRLLSFLSPILVFACSATDLLSDLFALYRLQSAPPSPSLSPSSHSESRGYQRESSHTQRRLDC